ncbi:MAG TPA: sugar phosphate nucleotidyltransferase, partial [Candidatus Methylacidiphilales bacterium]
MDDRSYICILAGGTGERFWPVSRKARPKHLVTLFGPDTLLEQAVRRAQAVVPKERIFVLTNDDQIDEARRILPFLGPDQIVAEPEKRDTAPACALATALARSLNPQAVLAVAPADALIHDGETYARQL